MYEKTHTKHRETEGSAKGRPKVKDLSSNRINTWFWSVSPMDTTSAATLFFLSIFPTFTSVFVWCTTKTPIVRREESRGEVSRGEER